MMVAPWLSTTRRSMECAARRQTSHSTLGKLDTHSSTSTKTTWSWQAPFKLQAGLVSGLQMMSSKSCARAPLAISRRTGVDLMSNKAYFISLTMTTTFTRRHMSSPIPVCMSPSLT